MSADISLLFARRLDSPSAETAFWTEVRRIVLAAHEHDEDAAQTTVLEVINSLPSFNGRAQFGHWLRALVRRQNADRLATKITERETLVELREETLPQQPSTSRLFDTSLIEDRQTRQAAELILQGHTCKDAASQVGLSPDALRKRLTRIHK